MHERLTTGKDEPDNGGLLGSTHNAPLRLGKGHAYEGGIRVPFIVRWPGAVPAGSVSHEPVHSIDVFPTILDAAAVALPKGRAIDGVSLVAHLKSGGKGNLKREALYWHFPHYNKHNGGPGTAVRKGNYKLIEFLDPEGVELYDLSKDIGETDNLAARMPGRTRELLGMIHDWRSRVGARMMTPNPDYSPAASVNR